MKNIYKCNFDGYNRNPLRPGDAVCRPTTIHVFAKRSCDAEKAVRKEFIVESMGRIEKV